ncbi:MAG: hypothetical protein WCA13_11625 [Terriglobales bacterium]
MEKLDKTTVATMLAGAFWHWEGWPSCVALLGGVSLPRLWLARISSRPLDRLDSAEIELVGD